MNGVKVISTEFHSSLLIHSYSYVDIYFSVDPFTISISLVLFATCIVLQPMLVFL